MEVENLKGVYEIDGARELGLARVDFYHYGFCRLRSLDWIRQSLNST